MVKLAHGELLPLIPAQAVTLGNFGPLNAGF
jgi:hypothetical protein